MDDDKGRIASWNSQLEKIIAAEGERCLCFSWLHDRSEKRYSSLTTYITLPSIILATLSGSASIGTNGRCDMPSVVNLNNYIGVSTLVVAMLTTVSSYFAWAKRSESHRIAAVSYKKMYRFILVELALSRSERMAAKDMLKVVRDESQRMEEISPQIPDAIISQFKKKFDKDTSEITKPEITNGLDPIYVYPSDAASPYMTAKPSKAALDLMDPIYRSPKPEISIPVVPINTTNIKISSGDHILDNSQKLSSAHLPTESASDNNHTSISSYTPNTTEQ
jgi:hypothetical protein